MKIFQFFVVVCYFDIKGDFLREHNSATFAIDFRCFFIVGQFSRFQIVTHRDTLLIQQQHKIDSISSHVVEYPLIARVIAFHQRNIVCVVHTLFGGDNENYVDECESTYKYIHKYTLKILTQKNQLTPNVVAE